MVEKISPKEEKDPDIKLRYGSMESFVSPEGAYVTRLTVDNKDFLFPDGFYLISGKEKRRGGIFPLFPYAGPLEEHPDWPQHGFARDMKWKEKTIYQDLEPSEVLLELKSDKETQKIFPYQFRNELKIALGENKLSCELTVFNEDNKDMPVALGFHPYFPLPSQKLNDIKTNLDGLNLEKYQLGETLVLPIKPEVKINIPQIGEIEMSLAGDFLKDKAQFWFWTDSPEYNYFCLEPCSVPVGGFLKEDERILVSPGESKKFIMNFKFTSTFE